MNIILLGNGFDLAHGLPTTYTNFLDFLKEIKQLSPTPPKVKFNQQINILLADSTNKATLRRIRKLCTNNIWSKYFLNRNYLYPNWCDFESEIEYITQNLQNIKKELEKNRELPSSGFFRSPSSEFFMLSIQQYLFNIIYENKDVKEGFVNIPFDHIPPNITITLGNNSLDKNNVNRVIFGHNIPPTEIHIPFEYLISFIIEQLNDFTKCFELYLSEFVNKIDTQKIHFIYDLMHSYNLKILNFNYTSTIELYTKPYDVDICYIHGKASNNDSNNLVLGINETENDIDPMFTRFRKYFQRFEKKCTFNYRTWINTINHHNMGRKLSLGSAEHKLYIIGHSLTLNDKNILNELITLPSMSTTIFYHSEDSKLSLMQNLAAILGSQKFTEYMEAKAVQFVQGNFEKKITRVFN